MLVGPRPAGCCHNDERVHDDVDDERTQGHDHRDADNRNADNRGAGHRLTDDRLTNERDDDGATTD